MAIIGVANAIAWRVNSVSRAIDQAKLKAAAEHLEWALAQYPDSSDVQALFDALRPMIEDARAERVQEPIAWRDLPGRRAFAEGVYRPYADPDVEAACSRFSIEMTGGWPDPH